MLALVPLIKTEIVWPQIEFTVWRPESAIDVFQAADKCAEIGARLATIRNQEENDQVRALAHAIGNSQCGGHVWMGLESSITVAGRTEGTWSWKSGESLSFQNWDPSQQDGGGTPPVCGGMYPWSAGPVGNWFDHGCNHVAVWCYACEKRRK